MTSEQVRRFAPLAVAVAVLGVVAGSGLLSSAEINAYPGSDRRHAGTAPPVLRLSGLPGTNPSSLLAHYRDGDLPDGPASARVFWPHGSRDPVRERLLLGGKARFDPDGSWAFGTETDPTQTVEKLPQKPTDHRRQAALDLAAPVLQWAGLPTESTSITTIGEVEVVEVQPRVAGLPTAGVATRVVVHVDRVIFAQGWDWRPGHDYPLITAEEALRPLVVNLPRLPVCLDWDPKAEDPRCSDGSADVVGATFGYSLATADDRRVLVPSWLFEVEGRAGPSALVAVDPSYLAQQIASDRDQRGALNARNDFVIASSR